MELAIPVYEYNIAMGKGKKRKRGKSEKEKGRKRRKKNGGSATLTILKLSSFGRERKWRKWQACKKRQNLHSSTRRMEVVFGFFQ